MTCTNHISIRGVLFEALAYIVYYMYYSIYTLVYTICILCTYYTKTIHICVIFLWCTSRKAIIFLEVKVDHVQRGP